MDHTCVVTMSDLELRVGNGAVQPVRVEVEVTLNGITLSLIRGRTRSTLRLPIAISRHIMFSVGRAMRDVMLSEPFI